MKASQVRILELLERWQDLAGEGRAPSAAELCRDCPELAEEVQRQIDFARGLDRLAGGGRPAAETTDFAATPGGDAEASGGGGSGPPEVPHYRLLSVLGEGGMGVVYRARDERLGRVVALKVIRDGLAGGAGLARFQVEAEAFARLNHPNVVQVYEVGQWRPEAGGPLPYLALELVEGESLERRLGERPAEPGEAARLVRLLARAVQAMHKAGVVHRDLKPGNVLMGPAADEPGLNSAWGCPKVTDFGLARRLEGGGRLTGTGHVMGTPAYMAPEQAAGQEAGPGADVYALGAILYRALSGRAAFDAPTPVELMCKVMKDAPPALPGELGALALRCMDKAPERRPTAGGLVAALDRYLAGRPEETLAMPAAPAAWPGPSRRAVLGAGVAVLGLAVAGWLAYWKLWPADGGRVEGGPGGVSTPEAPLEVRPLKVLHYERVVEDGQDRERAVGEVGAESFEARFNDAVTVAVELSRPAYLYLIAFNADGKEQLLWPADERAAPAKLARLRFPLEGKRFTLNDEPAGGAQAFVVVASAGPLPPYGEWRGGRRWPWGRHEMGRSVWQADDRGVYEVVPGKGVDRGTVERPRGAPPLEGLCRALKRDGVVVEAVAFAVRRREER